MTYITNLELVEYAKSKLEVPTIYILGGIGRVLTEDMIQYSINRGVRHTIAYQNIIRKGIGKYAFDCNAIFKSALWETSPGVIKYNVPNGSDLGVRSLYSLATEKGLMASMPDIPGLMVFTKDLTHVGMYVGKKNGVNQYIEATPAWSAWGVTTSADKNHPQGHNRLWHSWGKYHLAEYVAEKKDYHTVVKGEYLSNIAPKYDMTVDQLYNLNKNVITKGKNVIEIGMKLRLHSGVKEVTFYKEEPTPAPTPVQPKPASFKVGDTVQWSGRLHKTSYGKYPSSFSHPLRTGRISIVANAPYGIHIDGLGWIAPSQIKGVTQPTTVVNAPIVRGNTVRVIGTRWATGQLIPSFVKTKRYRVLEVDKARNRVLLEGVYSWAHTKDVRKV